MADKGVVLVIATEPQAEKLLKSILTAGGYQARFVADAKAAIQMHATLHPQLMVLDLDVSEPGARDTIIEARRCSDIPVIVLSRQNREADVVAALDLGADDYVVMPFRTSEFLARIRSALRRGVKARGEEAVYHCGDLRVDILDHSVMRQGEPIRLTPTEFAILAILVRSGGRVVSYEGLLQSLGQVRHSKDRQALRTFIWSLRQKLEDDPEHPRLVLTEERIGYRLVKDPLRSLS
jgi:two-component system KDP operon response regulator KdpE